ncbi:hypothetical protein ENUP19_0357G0003 [Entamoeba nuttalli]|uniref:Uncharacterized protein n=1 Tax=Entamoeba nuttalli TaxID=412467 RepID=A0ABQ0DY47_9EUKA
MATVQQGKKKMRIINGVLVEEDESQQPNTFRQAPPAQSYNLFPIQTNGNNQRTSSNNHKQEEVVVPYAMPGVFVLLSESIFFDWSVVLVTFIIMIIVLAYFIVRK